MEARMDIVKEAKRITVKVKIERVLEFRMRIWIAIKLVKLAVRIANFTYKEKL